MANSAPKGSSTIKFDSFSPNKPYTISESQLLQGFSDDDGDKMKAFMPLLTEGQGTVEKKDGGFLFTPAKDFTGKVTIVYHVHDYYPVYHNGKYSSQTSGFVDTSLSFDVKGDVRSPSEIIFDINGYYPFFAMLSSAVYLHTGVGNEEPPTEHRAFELNNYQKVISNPEFHFLTAKELGISSGNTSSSWYDWPRDENGDLARWNVDYKYDFKNGFYGTDAKASLTSPLGAAASFASVGATSDALFVTFRGTDQGYDWIADAVGMHEQYAMYSELTKAIDSYLEKNTNMKVFVSGHSLGGQMATMYMSEHFGDERFTAVEFEAANKLMTDNKGNALPAYNSNIVNIEMPLDPVPDLGFNRGDVIHVKFEDKNGTDYTHGIAADHPMSEVVKYIYEISNDKASRNPTSDVTLNLYNKAISLARGDSTNLWVEAQKATFVQGADLKGSDTVIIEGLDGQTYSLPDNLVLNNPVIKNITLRDDTYSPSNYVNYSVAANDSNGKAIRGNAGNNKLVGGKGNDILAGDNGNDTLIGGLGADMLSGEKGKDVFKFNSIAESGLTAQTNDDIMDFEKGDKIDLKSIDANTKLAKDQEFTFVGSFLYDIAVTNGTKFTNSLYFNEVTQILYGDVNSDNKPDFSIQLSGVSSLEASDFIL